MTLADVQGNVLRGYGTDHAHYVFARISDADAARRWLAGRVERITYADSWEASPPQHTLNVAFTCAGLQALGVPAERTAGLDAFAAGMAARASALGDSGDCRPEAWPSGLRGTHVLITLTAWRPDMLAGLRAELDERVAQAGTGLALTYAQTAATLSGAREHFGFGDGFSQPAIAGADTGPRDGEGTLTRWRRWRELEIGEFILGHRDEGGLSAPGPDGPLGHDSTFMVVRKLEQDVAGFRTYLAEQARRLARDEQWIAAKMIGRWQNGSPLATNPDRPGPPAADDRSRVNRFRYGGDPHGLACPLGAHVRRANPRDALGWQGRLTKRHRLIRRGMSYGPPLPDGVSTPDGRERGLMFICYQSSIERQFEFVQRQWLGDGNVFGLAGDRDPIAAGSPPSVGAPGAPARSPVEPQSTAEMVIQGTPPLFLCRLPRLVTTRGGDYFLVPGRAGLQALAAGRC